MKKNWIQSLTKVMSGCVIPIIPVMVGCGIIKLLVLVLDLLGLFQYLGDAQQVLACLNSAPFYFLPMFIAYSSAKYFGCNPVYAIAAVTVMQYPDFVAMMSSADAVTFLGIPVLKTSYAYGIIPPIVLIAVMKQIERAAGKWLPKALRSTFEPAVVILLTGLLGLIVVGPAVSTMAGWLTGGIGYLQENYPVIAWMVLCGVLPLMIITGTHFIFTAIALEQLGTQGWEAGFYICCFIMAMSITGACLAVVIRSTGETRQRATSNGITIFTTGVSEPALYGTLLPLRTPLVTTMIACAAAGIWQGIHTSRTFAMASAGIFGILIYVDKANPWNLIHVLICAVIGFTTSLTLTLLMYRPAKEK